MRKYMVMVNLFLVVSLLVTPTGLRALNVYSKKQSRPNIFSGQPFGYTNWVEGEPDDSNGLEDCIAIDRC